MTEILNHCIHNLPQVTGLAKLPRMPQPCHMTNQLVAIGHMKKTLTVTQDWTTHQMLPGQSDKNHSTIKQSMQQYESQLNR